MKPVNVIIIAVLVGVLGFFGGMKYRDYQVQKQRTNFGNGQFFRQGAAGPNSQNRNGNAVRFGAGGGVFGEIVSIDEESITVKMPDGGSKIILLTNSTSFNKSSQGSKNDLKQGEQVAVIGSQNSDGSVTAQSVQLNLQLRMINQQQPSNPDSK